MSLSYKLDSSEYGWWSNLISWLSVDNLTFFQGQAITPAASPTPDYLLNRWQNLAPTGEFIIRDGYYHNGYYMIVGSYSCRTQIYKDEPVGPDLGPFYFDAWDGFLLICRGHSMFNRRNPTRPINPSTSVELGPPKIVPDVDSYSFIPMRMPFIGSLASGAAGPAVFAPLDDSTQGLYGVIPMKSSESVSINNETPIQSDLTIQVCGYHNIRNDLGYNASLNTLDGMESKPYYAYLRFEVSAFDPEDTRQGTIQYTWDRDTSIESCWQGALAQSNLNTGGTNVVYGGFGNVRDIDEIAIVGNMTTAVGAYTPDDYLAGMLPDGTNPSGGITGNDERAFSNGYAPSKFLGFNDFSEFYVEATATIVRGVHNLFAGETYVWDTTDPTGTVTDSFPFILYQWMHPQVPYDMAAGDVPYDYLGPYFLGLPAYRAPNSVVTGSADLGFTMFDTTPTRAVPFFSGAVAVDILPPSESIRGEIPATNEVSNLAVFAINNFLDEPAGNRETAFFSLRPYDFYAHGTNTAVSYGMSGTTYVQGQQKIPTEVSSTAIQYRTFTVGEEDISKNTVGPDGKPIPGQFSIVDLDTGEYVGYIGNYWRFPTFPSPANSGVQVPPDAGIPSRSGFGFGGNEPLGPYLTLYDSNFNTPSVSGVFPALQITQEGIIIGAGPTIDTTIVSGTATDRNVISCRWDNDRDQWLLTTTDPTYGWSVVSANATWDDFLDQTDNFKPPAAFDAATYFPITMSNSLDGLIVWGLVQTEATGKVGIRSSTPTTFSTYTWGPTGSQETFSYATDSNYYAVRIDGTTGREARVWIDYMLYDGVDAVIAMQLRDWGMRVTVENVEWFKARVLQDGDLKAKGEEIEQWMEEQGKQYTDMLKAKERSGRLRKRRSQISAYKREVGDLMTPDQLDTQVYDFVPKGIAAQQRFNNSEGALKEVPPDSIEAMVERDYRAGFDTTPSGLTEPGEQIAEDPAKPAGTFMDTGDGPKKAPDEGGDPDEEYISED
jgi:hypothetical protein